MLRPFHRAPSSSIFLGGPSIRTNVRKPLALTTKCLCKLQQQQTRHSTTTTTTPTYDSTTTPPPSNPSNPPNHPISNPTLVDIEKRWVPMPPEEQAELWMALRDRMKNDWHDLSFQERKAAYFIAFGPHGPRAEPPPGQLWFYTKWTVFTFALAGVILAVARSFAGPAPRTMNKEWQEATNEYLKRQKVEPITGISSEGYKGRGHVQSRPKRD